MMIKVSAVRWWQWLGLAMVVGLLLGGARIYWEGQSADPTAMVVDQDRFERWITSKGDRVLSGITVFPAKDGFHFVSASRSTGKNIAFAAPEEYQPKLPALLAGKTMKFREYLDQQSVAYNYIWTEDSRTRMAFWVGLSVAVIGFAWPLLLKLLIRLGYAPAPPVPAPAYNLDRFKTEEKTMTAASNQISQSDREKLRQLEAELDRNLRGGANDAPAALRRGENMETSPKSDEGLQPNARFSATQTETVQTVETPKEDKTYRGTFYPTEVHTPKKQNS